MIFVFGSNLAGRHGAGAALDARRLYGAKYGVGEGPTGSAYALPTKDANLNTLPLDRIALYVEDFLKYAKANPMTSFKVTKVGCGLAGYKESDIKPLFADAPANCHLPGDWSVR
jgi:hypothetical protein